MLITFKLDQRQSDCRIISEDMSLIGRLAWVFLLMWLLALAPAYAQEKPPEIPWTGKLADGWVINKKDLDKILQDHKLWDESDGKKGKHADLRGAQLEGADLRAANLSRSDMSGADLRKAILIKADLVDADLSLTNFNEADLWGADLSKANLYRANISNASLFQSKLNEASLIEANIREANLHEASLNNACLIKANLTKAKLNGANLTGVILNDANLSDSDLEGASLNMAYTWFADFSGVIFEVKPGSLPNIPAITTAKNIATMTFKESPHALVELREAFKKSGLRTKEREITYAIEHGKRKRAWSEGISGKIESIFKLVFFEFTCKYGLSPGRPILIIGFLVLILALPYTLAVRMPGKDGIWKVWPADSIRVDIVGQNPELITASGFRALGMGFYFSLLSAFNIGWRDFNVGDWIARVQARDYTLRPTGWVRTLSGIQSLISLYLLALWVLTYFGRPFQQ